MCGIAGILRTWRAGETPPGPFEAIPESWLDVLDESIEHRGPDGCGRFRQRVVRGDGAVVDVALVHRRLSIIDHACGAQPMLLGSPPLRGGSSSSVSAERRTEEALLSRDGLPYGPLRAHVCPKCGPGLIAVVFNGCIYNHRELRRELEAVGHEFFTDHSDTEVLLHGWREWGLDTGRQIDGMAAVLAWDGPRGQLLMGRDLAGEKPLYHAVLESQSIVAWSSSEAALVRLLRAHDASAPLIYPLLMDDWLRFGWACEPVTATYTVSPGEWRATPLDPSLAGQVRGRYSSFERELPVREERSTGGPATVRSALEEAVATRLEADVPIGTFLSGGVDSALITAIAHNYRPDLQAFTVRMPDLSLDESAAATETARLIGCVHHILECRAEPAADLIALVEQLGAPFGDSSLLPTFWVSRAAGQAIKVALSGDGGDELFGGYQRHVANGVLNRYRGLLSRLPAAFLPRVNPRGPSAKLHRLIEAARYGGFDELVSIFATPDLRSLVVVDGNRPEAPEFEAQSDAPRYDFERYLPHDILRKTDGASMAVGLEVRSPLLSRHLVDLCLSIPLPDLMPGNQRKGLLRAVARKYLPAEIVDRPKMGFAIPIGEWFRSDYGGMRQLLYDHLESADPFPGLAEAGVELNMDFVRRMLREHDAAGEESLNPWHGRDHSQRLYMLLVLSIWCRWLRGIAASP